MAREIQRPGARALGGSHVRLRPHAPTRLAPTPYLPWRVGRRTVPIALRTRAEPARLLAADARVASDDGDPGGDGRLERRLPAVEAGTAALRWRAVPADCTGVCERGPRAIPDSAARCAPARAATLDGRTPPPATASPAPRPRGGGADALAAARAPGPRAALAGDGVDLERALGAARRAPSRARSTAARGPRLRAPRRSAR